MAPSGDDRRSPCEDGRHLALPHPDVAHSVRVAERGREKAVRIDDDRCPHRRHEAFWVDRVVRGPIRLDDDRRCTLRRVERRRAEREDAGEVIGHGAHGRVMGLHARPGAGELLAQLDRARTSQRVRSLLVDEAPNPG